MINSVAALAWAPTPRISILATRVRVGTRNVLAGEAPLPQGRQMDSQRPHKARLAGSTPAPAIGRAA